MFPGAELRLHARRVQFETINGAVTHSAAVGRNQTRTPNLALAPRRHRGDETNRPAPRNVGNQASKFFSTEEQGEHGGHGEGQYGASRGVRSGLARSAKFLLLRVLARPRCSSVLKNLLPYLGPAARTRHRWIAAGQREDGCISRGDARRAGPGGSPRKSMWYRRISGKSPQPAGIFKVSSAEEVHRTLPGRKSP
jgi:hypothetical protein